MSDAFVKLYIDDKFITKTKIIDENNTPVWKEMFATPLIDSKSMIRLLVFDKDPKGEELILSLHTTANEVVLSGKNATLVCSPAEEMYNLCYAIAWYPHLI